LSYFSPSISPLSFVSTSYCSVLNTYVYGRQWWAKLQLLCY
jgi:hypothetical protein